eukprot:1648656-Pyramimonas_sp.AAC.1
MGLAKNLGCAATADALSPKWGPGDRSWILYSFWEPEFHPGISRTWERVWDKLALKEGRWNKVVPFFPAVVAYLLDLGWAATTARLWA